MYLTPVLVLEREPDVVLGEGGRGRARGGEVVELGEAAMLVEARVAVRVVQERAAMAVVDGDTMLTCVSR